MEPAPPPQAIYLALGHWVALALLGAALVLTPLAFGGVMAWTWSTALVGVVLAAAAIVAGAWAAGVLEHERGPALVCLGIVAAVVALQQVPLPRGVLRALAPKTEEVFADALPAFAAGELWLPLAHDRAGALEATLKATCYLLAFLVARRLGRERRHARWLLWLLLGIGCFEAFYGLVEQFAGEGRIFGWHKPAVGEAHRASGTYVNPNHYAGFMAMCASVGLGLWLLRPRGAPGPALELDAGQRLILALTRPGAPKTLLLALAVVVVLAGLVGSVSRGGLLGLGGGVAAVALFAWRGGRMRVGTLIGLAAVGAVVIGLASAGVARLSARLSGEKLAGEGDPAIPSRLSFAQHTLGLAVEHPLTGVGAGSFEPAFARTQPPGSGVRVDHAHNDYAELLAELGIVAWTALGAALLLLVRDVLRGGPPGREAEERHALARVALAGVAPLVLHSLVDFDLRLPGTALWAAVLLGLAWGVARPEQTVARPLPGSLVARAGLVALLLALGALPCWAALAFARADWVAFPRIERALGDERAPEVQLEDLQRACAVWPWDGRHWARVASLRYQVAMQREIDATEAAVERVARALTEPAARQRLRDAVFTSRLRTSPELAAAREQAAGEALRALELTPGSRLHKELWRSLLPP